MWGLRVVGRGERGCGRCYLGLSGTIILAKTEHGRVAAGEGRIFSAGEKRTLLACLGILGGLPGFCVSE